jgi:hypothetical protein
LLDTGLSQKFILQESTTEMEEQKVKGIQITGLNNTKVGESRQVANIKIVNKEEKKGT